MKRAVLIGAVLVAASGKSAVADDVEVLIEVIEQAPGKDLPPDLQASVRSALGPPAITEIELVQEDRGGPIAIRASELRSYVEGDEPLALVVVVEAHGVWIGNAGVVEESDPGFFVGVYKPLVAALDGLNVAGPPGSKAAVVTYARGATLGEWGFVDLAKFTGDMIGTPKTLAGAEPGGQTNRDLVAGVTEAAALLARRAEARKVLVVVGDGVDTNHDQGLAQLAQLGKQLANDHIEVYAIYLESELEGDPNAFKKLTKDVIRLDGTDGLPAAVSRIVDALADRYYVRIPGADLELQRSFSWDGKPHTFTLKVAKESYEVLDEVVLAPSWTPPWLRPGAGKPTTAESSPGEVPARKKTGCCQTGEDGAPLVVVVAFLGLALTRRRRSNVEE